MKNLFMMIILVYCQLWGGKTNTVTIYSPAMNKDIPALIIIPDSYVDGDENIPVILLLHGYGGDYKNWSDHTSLGRRADVFNLIIVCPDGNRNSWYLDSPMDPDSQYETFFINELIPWIKKNYKTNQFGITGLSMGGHGAFYLAIRHPELFDAVSGMSIDSSGNVFISGYTEGGLDGNTNSGNKDIFLVKYNSDGVLQ